MPSKVRFKHTLSSLVFFGCLPLLYAAKLPQSSQPAVVKKEEAVSKNNQPSLSKAKKELEKIEFPLPLAPLTAASLTGASLTGASLPGASLPVTRPVLTTPQTKSTTSAPSAALAPSLASAQPVEFPSQMHRKTIIIDAGHGGTQRGTHSDEAPRYEEKQLALSTARYLQEMLHKLGYKVLMTREFDKTLSLQERAAFANHHLGDLFISIHFNSAPSKEACGVEVFYSDDQAEKWRETASKKLAALSLESVGLKTGAHKRAVKHANFAVLKRTHMPAILVEGGFLTNEAERERCLQTAYQKRIALGLALAVEFYFAEKRIDQIEEGVGVCAL